MKRFLVLIAICILPGCAAVLETSDKAAQKLGEGTIYYCENVPAEIRATFRVAVNAYSEPHTMHVHCAGDSE